MPLARLYKDTHKLGYNTRDNPQDIPFEACQAMVNMFPGDPSPQPRFGVDRWNTNALPGAVKRSFPWVDAIGGHKAILHISDGLYWQVPGSGALNTIHASIVPAGSKLSAIRIKDQLLINSDLTGEDHRAWFVAWDGTEFTIRNANIQWVHFNLGPFAADSGSAVLGGRAYSFTLVNRNDPDSMDGSGDPIRCDLTLGTFHPGLLESVCDTSYDKFIYVGGTARDVNISINTDQEYDPQATHLRIYGTVSAVDIPTALGLERRWLADLPIKGANFPGWEDFIFVDEFSDATLAGALDVLKTVGYSPIPPGKYLVHHQGRVWTGGVGTGEGIGRNYYSEAPLDVEYPHKWWSMFEPASYFKDTSYEDAEPCMGLAVAGNDLIFFMAISLWFLQDGDVEFEPRRISRTKGTRFPNTITQRDKEVMYLSNEGPAVVSVQEVEAITGHTAGEVWPKLHDNSTGYYFGLADKTTVYGFYFRETWWLTDEVKLIGFFMPAMSRAQGPMSVEFADASIGFGIPLVLDSEDLCVLASRLGAGYLWNFLNKAVHSDNGASFMLKGKSKAMYVSQKDRDRAGEAYNLKWFAHYEDSAPLFIEFISDFFRFQIELQYDQYTTESPLISPDAAVSFRNMMEQPMPEGLIFNSGEIAWRKEHRTPYAFKHSGFILEYHPRDGRTGEFVSRAQGDGLVLPFPDTLFYATFDEDSDTLTDHSLQERHHTFADGSGGSRLVDPSLIPGGGQSLVGGQGSGYANVDWTALEHVGDEDGFNSSPLIWEYVGPFPSLAAEIIIHEIPGTEEDSFVRLQVNIDGSLEFQIQTSELAYSFTTAAGIIVEGSTDYTIQFILSNGGMNGQFYAAGRASAFATLLTTRREL